MSNQYQCEILKETQPLKEYSEYNNDSTVVPGGLTVEGGSQLVYTVYGELDRTPQLNCLIKWKNELTSIIQDEYPDINLNQTNQDITALQSKVNEYANKIEEIDGLKKSLNGYNNTKLKYIDQEFEVERKMQKQLLDDYIKRARKDRLDIQEEFDMKVEELKAKHEKELDEQDTEYQRTIESNQIQFDNTKAGLISKHNDQLKEKETQIDILEQNLQGSDKLHQTNLAKTISELEASAANNNQKDLQLQYASLENKANKKLYNFLEKDNRALELASQNAHNILSKDNIKSKIDKDMQFINQIQTMNRNETFTNMVTNNKTHFLLGLGLLSAGFIIYRIKK